MTNDLGPLLVSPLQRAKETDQLESLTAAESTASAPAKQASRKRRVYLLTLEPSQSAGDIRRLRGLLKILLRRYGMRCLAIEEARR